ncbi:MAG: hypothetical protein V3T46_03015 [Alphaproteobacteria bacterium]
MRPVRGGRTRHPSEPAPHTKDRSVNALGVLVRAKARIGLKNLAYNMRRLVQLGRHAMAGAP